MDDTRGAAEQFARRFPAIYLRFHRRDAKGAGLTSASRAVLEHLALAEPLTVGELSCHLDRAQSVVSDIVAHLEDARLLERQGDPTDRRRRLVWLSPFGRELLGRDREVLSVELLERAFAVMADNERVALMDGIDALLRADDAVGTSRPTSPTNKASPPLDERSRDDGLGDL